MDKDGQSGTNLDNFPDNPTVKITLEFQDGAHLDFLLKEPVPQFDAMKWIGRFLGETGNLVEIDL